jgi:P pilus assembly chaperone PapD
VTKRLLGAAALALLMPNGVRAQLAVNHVELIVHADVRAERDAVIGVRNEGEQTVQAVVRLEDWDRASDGTNRWYPLGSQRGSCGRALQIFPLSMSLDPGAAQSIRVTVDSALAPPTECWAAAVVETARPGVQGGQRVTYVLRTAVKIYIQRQGLRADGEITDLQTTMADPAAPRDSTDSAHDIELAFTNTGARHVVAQGSVEIRRLDNSLAARVAIPDIYAVPGACQVTRMRVPRLAKGRYIVLALLDYGGDEIAAAQIEYEVK